jgi:hypothetical protein
LKAKIIYLEPSPNARRSHADRLTGLRHEREHRGGKGGEGEKLITGVTSNARPQRLRRRMEVKLSTARAKSCFTELLGIAMPRGDERNALATSFQGADGDAP